MTARILGAIVFSVFTLLAASFSYANEYVLERVILNPTPADGERFGHSVDLENSILVVGARGDDLHATNTGVVHLFDAHTGLLIDTIANPTPQDHDGFGAKVAISDNLITIGALNDKTQGGIPHGSVYLYDVNSNLISSILDPSPASENNFGIALDLDNQGFITSSQLFDSNGKVNNGIAYYYDLSNLGVPVTLPNPGPVVADEDRFGSDVAQSDNFIAVGKPGLQLNSTIAGTVEIYNRSDFSHVQTLISPDSTVNDQFGRQIVFNNNHLLIASPHTQQSAHAGSVYLYELNAVTGQFELKHAIDNPFPAAGDIFGGYEGGSIALLDDVVIASSLNDDNVGTDSGEVYVFDIQTGDLIQTISNPDSSPAYDSFSWSIAADEDLLAISAVSDEQPGFNASGKVYVYRLDNNNPPISCWDLNQNGIEDPILEDVNNDGVVDVEDCTGAPGQDGLSCWDINGDGVKDADEDQNQDGIFDALDCIGADGPQGPQGPQGLQGDDGLSCWDLDGDGLQDPDEDNNQDGVFNALDCVGPEGPQGPMGQDGADGSNGAPGADGQHGLACWDLDGDGHQDPNEDVNADGNFDALDCAGPPGQDGLNGLDGQNGAPGQDGLSCWDLNGNGVKDALEDQNSDGLFDALDCVGPQGPAGQDGAPGLDGEDGAPGIPGADGQPGRDGIDGQDGQPGRDGIDGQNGAPGRDGIDGKDGLSCWDLNADGFPDLNEDQNQDGLFDALDCIGPQGPAGEDGAPGRDGVDGQDGEPGLNGVDGKDGEPGRDGIDGKDGVPGLNGADGEDGKPGLDGRPGIDGKDGLSCWDLDGDGQKDSEEDLNQDGIHDALDCRGEPGDSEYYINSPTLHVFNSNPGPVGSPRRRKVIRETCPDGGIAVGGGIGVSGRGGSALKTLSVFPRTIHTWQAVVYNEAPNRNNPRNRAAARLFLTCKAP